MTKFLNSYIKNISFIYFIYLFLTYSLLLLDITNVAERRDERRGDKMSMLRGENREFIVETLGESFIVLLLASV